LLAVLPGRTENAVKNRFNSSARKKWLSMQSPEKQAMKATGIVKVSERSERGDEGQRSERGAMGRGRSERGAMGRGREHAIGLSSIGSRAIQLSSS
jgi:hypothetical protein